MWRGVKKHYELSFDNSVKFNEHIAVRELEGITDALLVIWKGELI